MSIWDHRQNFLYDEPLAPNDPRRANLNAARGDYNRHRLLRELGLNVKEGRLCDIPSGKCVLFGGHRGCGKSTELLEISADLAGPERYFVVAIDAQKSLDINNLSYADVALSLAEALAAATEKAGISVPEIHVAPLHKWFMQVTRSTTLENSASAELQAGAEAKVGFPWVGSLFAKLTTAIRSNTTHKTEIRENVRNGFTALAAAFNTLLTYIQEEVVAKGLGKAVIFVIDGTDRLGGDEADAFFNRDIHQLRLLRVNCIYCAPISVLNEQGQIAQNFDAVFRLPMVKLVEKGQTDAIPEAWDCLRDFIQKRLPIEHFDRPATLDHLIAHSGGHPRDLLRLVNLCFQEIDEGPITQAVAEIAAQRLSKEYKRLIQPGDFALLAEIDRKGTDFAPATDDTRRLLYNLVLLEYNGYWWQSHPAVRALEGYRTEKARLDGLPDA